MLNCSWKAHVRERRADHHGGTCFVAARQLKLVFLLLTPLLCTGGHALRVRQRVELQHLKKKRGSKRAKNRAENVDLLKNEDLIRTVSGSVNPGALSQITQETASKNGFDNNQSVEAYQAFAKRSRKEKKREKRRKKKAFIKMAEAKANAKASGKGISKAGMSRGKGKFSGKGKGKQNSTRNGANTNSIDKFT